jgi:hypothetical protein
MREMPSMAWRECSDQARLCVNPYRYPTTLYAIRNPVKDVAPVTKKIIRDAPKGTETRGSEMIFENRIRSKKATMTINARSRTAILV